MTASATLFAPYLGWTSAAATRLEAAIATAAKSKQSLDALRAHAQSHGCGGYNEEIQTAQSKLEATSERAEQVAKEVRNERDQLRIALLHAADKAGKPWMQKVMERFPNYMQAVRTEESYSPAGVLASARKLIEVCERIDKKGFATLDEAT